VKPQILEKNGKPEFAVLPFSEYQALMEELETLKDIRDFDLADKKIRDGEESLVPSEVVYRILDGIHPVRVWREHRKMSLHRLAESCGVSDAAISQIENRKREPSVKLLKSLAQALDVDLDDLVP
jgi:DNA-binding XRE family transcriptional regulator